MTNESTFVPSRVAPSVDFFITNSRQLTFSMKMNYHMNGLGFSTEKTYSASKSELVFELIRVLTLTYVDERQISSSQASHSL